MLVFNYTSRTWYGDQNENVLLLFLLGPFALIVDWIVFEGTETIPLHIHNYRNREISFFCMRIHISVMQISCCHIISLFFRLPASIYLLSARSRKSIPKRTEHQLVRRRESIWKEHNINNCMCCPFIYNISPNSAHFQTKLIIKILVWEQNIFCLLISRSSLFWKSRRYSAFFLPKLPISKRTLFFGAEVGVEKKLGLVSSARAWLELSWLGSARKPNEPNTSLLFSLLLKWAESS